jgi:CubicO group peptidase (beta-lactamase class C family)
MDTIPKTQPAPTLPKNRHHTRPMLTRRQFLASSGWGALALVARQGFPAANSAPSVAEAFDRQVEQFMQARQVPGGALAVVKDRRLVYARGYGWADREKRISTQPNSLFRIASISKPLTAVAVLKLFEEGKLDLEARAFEIAKLEPVLRSGQTQDPRLARITVRQMLQHTAGWDRGQSFDPMFRCRQIAKVVGVPEPPDAEAIIRFMLGRPLDFDPGTRYAYSNFGYCVLGRVIERVTGQPYERFVRERILAPIGIQRMRIGTSLDRARDEVRYYQPDADRVPCVFPNTLPRVPCPYGGFYLEAMDAHGGWIASAVDLARFAAALDDPEHSPLLKPPTLQTMLAPPPPPVSRQQDGSLERTWYGCGWSVRPVGKSGATNFWHTGSLPGTYGLVVRRHDGLIWAVLFNQRSENPKLPDSAIDPAMHRAADSVGEWPTKNLFSNE